MTTRPFEVICEVEPATRPDLMRVRHQIGVLSPISSAFLIPDNHIGRATVSSIAVAHEVARMGGRAIACLNARDWNVRLSSRSPDVGCVRASMSSISSTATVQNQASARTTSPCGR